MTALWTLEEGDAALIIDVPHAGTWIPPDLRERLTPLAQTLADTDWHVPRLYEFALAHGVTVMAATHSRYVIDLNRAPDDAALYPGASNTELCPTTSFRDEPLYRDGATPDETEIALRRERCWMPYHAELARQIERVRARHGYVVLLDAHSIQSVLPRFFDGQLPDLNLGTASGTSCSPALRSAAYSVLQSTTGFGAVCDGRFRGGYITRHYGAPADGVHALQLEITQRSYMDEAPPFSWQPGRAARLRAVLEPFVARLRRWRPGNE